MEKHSEIGEISFPQGGTLAGYVFENDLPKDPKDLRIEVFASTKPSESANRPPRAGPQIVLGPRGFFSTKPLTPGLYDVLVDVRGVGVATVAAVPVREGFEARLPRPLKLEPRAALALRLKPEQPPAGANWQIELHRATSEGNIPVTRGAVSSDGVFQAENLVSGKYLVIIDDGGGSRWAHRNIDLVPNGGEVLVEIPVIFIEGTVQRGAEPISGKLIFGGEHGVPSIQFESDPEGHFRGMLPRAGEWTVDVLMPPGRMPLSTHAEVKVDDDEVGHVDIKLAQTLVEGSVTDTNGKPVPGAEVAFTRGPERLGITLTDGSGRFSLAGVLPGPTSVLASAPGSRSNMVDVTIHETANDPLRLVVHKLVDLRSRVIGPTGPVGGARVAIWPQSGGQVSLSVTDSEGYFTAMGHPPSQQLSVAVHSPGLAAFFTSIRGDGVETLGQITLTSLHGSLDVTSEATIHFLEHAGVTLPMHLAFRLLSPEATTDAEGRSVRLGDLPAGEYRVCRLSAAGVPVCAMGSLAPGGTLRLKIGGANDR